MGRDDVHLELEQAPLDPVLLHRGDRPGGHAVSRRHEHHAPPGANQELGEDAAHVVVIVVEDRDELAVGQPPGHEVIGRQHRQRRIQRDPAGVMASDAVRAPAGAGRDGDVVEVVAEDLVGGHPALRALDRSQPLELGLAVVDDADVARHPGQPRLARGTAAESGRLLGQDHLVAPLAQRLGRLEPRRATSHDQHLRLAHARPDPLGMPATPPLLPHRRVLGAADRGHREVARHADVAPDALPDVVEAPLLDLAREERVGDRRSCGADEIEHAAV